MAGRYEIVDPYADAPNDADLDRYLGAQGWVEFLGVGGEYSHLHIRTWQRSTPEGSDEYLACVSSVDQWSPFVKADNFLDLMDLIARWAPAVQAATVAGLVGEVVTGRLSTAGVVETLAAKVAYGVSDALPVMRQQEADFAARAREARHSRRQGGEVP